MILSILQENKIRMHDIYKANQDFYERMEWEFRELMLSLCEWKKLHWRYLFYYITKFKIRDVRAFNICHYRVSYRLYLWHLRGKTPSLIAWWKTSKGKRGCWYFLATASSRHCCWLKRLSENIYWAYGVNPFYIIVGNLFIVCSGWEDLGYILGSNTLMNSGCDFLSEV